MHVVLNQIARCLQKLREPEAFTEGATSPIQTTLSPWALWLLLALIRQVDRQRWVSSMVITKLGVDMNAMSAAGALAHPPVSQSGLVPDYPAWEYYFHGRGCCLTNRISGELIDVDFYDGISDWIDDFFYVRFLESLKKPEPIERRLKELYPSIETVVLGIDELLDNGLLQRLPDSKVIKPLDEFQELSEDIEALNAALDSEAVRLHASKLFGDWLLAVRCKTGSVESQEKATGSIAKRRTYLESRYALEKSERLALVALYDLVPDSTEYLVRAFKKEPSGTTSAALEIVSKRQNEDWSDSVYGLLCRTNPDGDLPHPYTWTKCAEYLLQRRSHFNQVRSRFAKIGRRSLGDGAILALEHFPELAVDLFRRALRSDVPMDRITAAAALAIVDQPWSHRILLGLLQESIDQEATSECRAALMATPHTHLHEIVALWEQSNPHEPESGPFITMAEMSLRSRDSYIQHEMESLHDRVIKLRSVCPPETDASLFPRRWWWPF